MATTGEPTIHRMREQDIPVARRILWETWVATYASFIPESDLQSYFDGHYSPADFRLMLQNPDVETFVAEVRGAPAGFARIQFSREEQRLYLGSLYVLPHLQGMGVGGALLKRAEQSALERSLNEVWLGVMLQNSAALDWYRRLGFTFVREEPFVMGKTSVLHLIGFRPILIP